MSNKLLSPTVRFTRSSVRDAKYRSVNMGKMLSDFEYSMCNYQATDGDRAVVDVLSLITAAETFENCRDNLDSILPTLTSSRALTFGVPLIGRTLNIGEVPENVGDNPYLLRVIGMEHTVPYMNAADLKELREQKLELPNAGTINCLLLCPTSLSSSSWVRNVQSFIVLQNEVYVHGITAGLASALIDFLLSLVSLFALHGWFIGVNFDLPAQN